MTSAQERDLASLPAENASGSLATWGGRHLLTSTTAGCTEALERLKRAQFARRWRSDHSAFSTLNIDAVQCRRPALKQSSQLSQLQSVSAASQPSKVDLDVRPLTSKRLTAADFTHSRRPLPFQKVRDFLLGFRGLTGSEESNEFIVCLAAEEIICEKLQRLQSEPASTSSPKAKPLMRQTSMEEARAAASLLSPRSPTKKESRAPPLALPSPSASAYRVGSQALSKEDNLKRTIQGLLNRICPENVMSIVEKIGAIEVEGVQQLEIIIEFIFRKAITEPHYCETYADVVFSLKSAYPEFPAEGGGRPVTFKGLVLNICQNEFEDLLASSDASKDEKAECQDEELEALRKNRRERMRANMKFIGHLFLRQLLSAKVIGSIICELVLFEEADVLPEEHALDCACELLLAIGYTLETMPAGQVALKLACQLLQDLMNRKLDGGKSAYSKRMQFLIQDVLETRTAGWTKKVFKTAAKTKEEIRMAQERDLQDGNKSAGEHVVTGARPLYLTDAS